MWKNYKQMLYEIGKVDLLVVNGDAIEGHGVKSSGS